MSGNVLTTVLIMQNQLPHSHMQDVPNTSDQERSMSSLLHSKYSLTLCSLGKREFHKNTWIIRRLILSKCSNFCNKYSFVQLIFYESALHKVLVHVISTFVSRLLNYVDSNCNVHKPDIMTTEACLQGKKLIEE